MKKIVCKLCGMIGFASGKDFPQRDICSVCYKA